MLEMGKCECGFDDVPSIMMGLWAPVLLATEEGRALGPLAYERAAAQRMQVAAVGRAARRSAPIGRPHRSQVL